MLYQSCCDFITNKINYSQFKQNILNCLTNSTYSVSEIDFLTSLLEFFGYENFLTEEMNESLKKVCGKIVQYYLKGENTRGVSLFEYAPLVRIRL